MPATFQTDGVLEVAQGGNDMGAACTGIGVGSGQSGAAPPGNFTDSAGDFLAWHIGGNVGGTGQVVNPPVTVTAGAGYTDGTYRVQSAGGGQPSGMAEVEFVVSGGALVSARVTRPGSGFTSAPTFTVANGVNAAGAGPGAGAGGALLVAVGLLSQAFMRGAAFGANKNTQRLTAVGAVAINAAVAPSAYLNRSGRAMVAGDSTWAVEP